MVQTYSNREHFFWFSGLDLHVTFRTTNVSVADLSLSSDEKFGKHPQSQVR
jgi:hypothetical protein